MTTGRTNAGRSVPARDARPRTALPRRDGIARRAAGALLRRPGLVLLAVAIGGGGGLFGWNALTQQNGKHPAPLFAKKAETPPPVPPRRAESMQPAPALPRGDTAASAPPSLPMETVTRTSAIGDPIGSLIRGGDGAGKAAEFARGDGGRIAAAQRALSKLGYGPLKSDGIWGGTTRQALQRFEKDKNLPVTGELAGRTLKQLASASGIRVE